MSERSDFTNDTMDMTQIKELNRELNDQFESTLKGVKDEFAGTQKQMADQL